jgi:hypothetical protein
MSAEKKRRRSSLAFAVCLAVIALIQASLAWHAHVTHTLLNYKGSWFTPEIGYFVAVCFFAAAAIIAASAFRRSNDEKK